jgi:hypothetical protein
MKSFFSPAKPVLFSSDNFRCRLYVVLLLCFFNFCGTELYSQNCNKCSIPAFPSVTVYQTVQTGPGIGFGIEGGNWKKDAGKFSYFFGTSIVWNNRLNTAAKTESNQYTGQTMINFYLKGQYRISKHLYAVAAPGIGNLSYFELQTGLRYVVPVTKVIGIGIEPAYAFHQKELVANINFHFALK